MALKILLACLLIAMASSVPSSPEDHHRLPSHRVVWPAWYRDRLLHARHDEHRAIRETTTTRGPWSPLQVSATRSPQQINSVSRHHRAEHKFGVVTIAEQDGTRATAYAGYRDDHRHQPREAVTQTYQLAPTAAPTYTRYHAGRRVCTRQAPVTSHHRGKQIRLVYTEMTSNFFCCPGWSQVTHLSFGCNKPTCPALCLNGGICTSGKCTCPKGYTGNQCQTDVDECAIEKSCGQLCINTPGSYRCVKMYVDECTIEKPCGQLCINTPGSYRCYCRAGFKLQQDGQSCRRNDTDENAFEARDLENDFHDMSTTKDPISSHDTENEVNNDDQDYEIILKRLTKLEKQVAKNRKKDTEASEMNTKVTLAIENINEMKRTVENVQLMQQEVYDMRNKMKQYEVEMRKIHHLMNRIAELETHLRIRCRSAIPINSGLLNF